MQLKTYCIVATQRVSRFPHSARLHHTVVVAWSPGPATCAVFVAARVSESMLEQFSRASC
eukprot:91276-Lingulodinium_polyedra.AAC.1